MRLRLAGLLAGLLVFASVPAVQAEGGVQMGLSIRSAAFEEGKRIPKVHTCEGSDSSPELTWDGAPDGTKSFSLVVEDPDAPSGTFIHWVLYDIPASAKKLEVGAGGKSAAPSKQGRNDFGRTGYGGPCPPKGHGDHRYHFILRAHDVETLGLAAGASRKDVERAVKGHVLGEARTTGTYSR